MENKNTRETRKSRSITKRETKQRSRSLSRRPTSRSTSRRSRSLSRRPTSRRSRNSRSIEKKSKGSPRLPTFFSDLPNEMLENITQYLSPKEAINFRNINKEMRERLYDISSAIIENNVKEVNLKDFMNLSHFQLNKLLDILFTNKNINKDTKEKVITLINKNFNLLDPQISIKNFQSVVQNMSREDLYKISSDKKYFDIIRLILKTSDSPIINKAITQYISNMNVNKLIEKITEENSSVNDFNSYVYRKNLEDIVDILIRKLNLLLENLSEETNIIDIWKEILFYLRQSDATLQFWDSIA
jgi:hypothetical protein